MSRHRRRPDSGRAGSGRAGSGRAGSGRAGSGRAGSGRAARRRGGRPSGARGRAAAGLSALLVVLLLAVVSVLAGRLVGVRLFRVESGSMSPTLLVGDVLLSHTEQVCRAHRGDIVTYRHPGLASLVTHRVTAARCAGGWAEVTTKGDANAVAETWRVPATSRVGRVLFRVPLAGPVSRAADTGALWLLMLGAGCAYAGLRLLLWSWRPATGWATGRHHAGRSGRRPVPPDWAIRRASEPG